MGVRGRIQRGASTLLPPHVSGPEPPQRVPGAEPTARDGVPLTLCRCQTRFWLQFLQKRCVLALLLAGTFPRASAEVWGPEAVVKRSLLAPQLGPLPVPIPAPRLPPCTPCAVT